MSAQHGVSKPVNTHKVSQWTTETSQTTFNGLKFTSKNQWKATRTWDFSICLKRCPALTTCLLLALRISGDSFRWAGWVTRVGMRMLGGRAVGWLGWWQVSLLHSGPRDLVAWTWTQLRLAVVLFAVGLYRIFLLEVGIPPLVPLQNGFGLKRIEDFCFLS